MYKYETHLHTSETSPCGKVKAQEAVRIYNKAGYTGLIITDHYYRGFFERHPFLGWDKKIDLFLEGYRKALEEGQRLGMDIQLGMEINFIENANDYLVYGFDETFLRENRNMFRLSLKEFRELANEKGIIIIQAHPFRKNMIPAPPELIDGVEVYNGNPRHDSANHLALQYALDNRLKMLSGSDFHQLQDVARGGVLVGEKVWTQGFAYMILQNKISELIKTE